MADLRVGMDLGTGDNDGTSWANAYQGKVGFASAVTAQTVGETIYAKDTVSSTDNMQLNGLTTLAALTNPVRCIGVVTGASDTILKADILLGFREGDSTKAYAQGGETPPTIVATVAGDIEIRGSLYFYAFILEAQDNFFLGNTDAAQHQIYEECKFVTGTNAGDRLELGSTAATSSTHKFIFINCLFTCTAVALDFLGQVEADFFNCEFTGTEVGFIEGSSFGGRVRFYNCDFTGIDATVVDKNSFHGGILEFHNCRMPASHILTTGTATGLYFIANYGSEDNTGFNSADSEQQLEIETLEGLVDIETTKVHTSPAGADDGATDSGGPFSWGMTISSVSDNFVGVVSPWMYRWVEGDGTAKTITVYIANDGAGDLEDDELYLEVTFPSETGLSMYDYLPNDGAPTDGGGRMQILGTPAVIGDDTGSTWGGSVGNHQKFTQSIAPDYRGLVAARVHYSKSGGAVMYIDPKMAIA